MDEQPGPQPPRSIVVGVVPGQPAAVLAQAGELARLLDAEVVCATVDTGRYIVAEQADGSVMSLPFDPDPPDLDGESFDPSLAARIRELLDEAGVRWSIRTLAGDPASALAELAETIDAQFIVIGTRSRGAWAGIQEFFTGSVAVRLAHRQHRPVLVVPTAPSDDLPW